MTIGNENGFALPSVLLLVSLLSTLILFIVFAQYFRRAFAYRELSRTKANIAAQNGVIWCMASGNNEEKSLSFEDGTAAAVTVYPWGVYRLVASSGSCGRSTAEYLALLGEKPDKNSSSAFEFPNDRHQLVLGGDAHVVGDVHVGNPGMSTGTLPSGRSLSHPPVTGRITRGGKFERFSFSSIEEQLKSIRDVLGSRTNRAGKATTSGEVQTFDLNILKNDSLSQIILSGNKCITGTLMRRGKPISIYVRGDLTFSPGVNLYGPIRIIASGSIKVPSDARIDYAIVYSSASIQIVSSKELKVQLISPFVKLEKGTRLAYPSAVVSYAFQNDDAEAPSRGIEMMEDSEVDGAVMMNGRASASGQPELITMTESSKIIGSVYCEEMMTLDGTVIGKVTTDDLYFYQSPTRYYGWMRSGSVDRASLPPSYLFPIGFESENQRLEILDWI